MNPIKWKLHWQILLALGLAVICVGSVKTLGIEDSGFTRGLEASCRFVGDLFKNALKMVVVPLIVSSIISGVMSLGSERNVGRIGLKVLIYYSVTGLLAIVVGLILVNTLRPGVVDEELAARILGQAQEPDEFMEKVEGRGASDIVSIVHRMFPANIIQAATDNGQLLGVITFSLLFGFFISRLPDRPRQLQSELWESIQQVMMMVTNLIIKFAPLGVFGLVTPIILRTGVDAILPLTKFFLTVLLGLAIHLFVSLGILVKLVGGIRPLQHFRAMAPVLLTAFSTASSASTLPVTMETVEKQAGVSSRTASFTLPLGATVNMDGTALYECVVVIFIGQIYGIEIGLSTQFSILVLALLTSIGVAGIPAASLVAITVILGVVGLPLEAVGLVWVTDRLLDMCRTAVNVFSDTCGAVIIGRSEGEAGIYGNG